MSEHEIYKHLWGLPLPKEWDQPGKDQRIKLMFNMFPQANHPDEAINRFRWWFDGINVNYRPWEIGMSSHTSLRLYTGKTWGWRFVDWTCSTHPRRDKRFKVAAERGVPWPASQENALQKLAAAVQNANPLLTTQLLDDRGNICEEPPYNRRVGLAVTMADPDLWVPLRSMYENDPISAILPDVQVQGLWFQPVKGKVFHGNSYPICANTPQQ